MLRRYSLGRLGIDTKESLLNAAKFTDAIFIAWLEIGTNCCSSKQLKQIRIPHPRRRQRRRQCGRGHCDVNRHQRYI